MLVKPSRSQPVNEKHADGHAHRLSSPKWQRGGSRFQALIWRMGSVGRLWETIHEHARVLTMDTLTQSKQSMADTHVVENVPPPLEDWNTWLEDVALRDAVRAFGGQWGEARLAEFGALCGSAERIEWGRLANETPPQLHTHDRYGHRVDEVEYHPAYHHLMTAAKGNLLHSLPWVDAQPGAHVVRAARWLPGITNSVYDPANRPDRQKAGLTIGMAMTEKQGGSDVRANSTRAHPVGQGGPGELYELVGHKFFVSAPMSDAFLMLAYTDRGLSCFLAPRWRPDGTRNPIQINQLKQKMGNVSNASCETELRGALGWMIGAEGRGVANILEMVALTRFDCAVASAAGMRQAVAQALHHCQYRSAFGARLADQPLMQNVLADLALEAEAAIWLGLRLAQALGHAINDEAEGLLLRIGTAVAKYWNCKRVPGHACEAMECIGGSGVMETTIMPRLYREAPVNAIWEGSGNVQCLDVLRAIQKAPAALDVFLQETARASGQNPLFDRYLQELKDDCLEIQTAAYRARTLVGKMARAWQASLLIRHAVPEVAEAYCASRLDGHSGHLYGTLPKQVDCRAIMARAWPRGEGGG
jgi:putative acyl-CoA dehydrogenase